MSRTIIHLPGVRGGFDAASNTREARRHWKEADFYSADAALTPSVRRTIASRARQEAQNNSFLAGILETIADDTVGTGPRLQLYYLDGSEGEELARREKRFSRWAVEVELAAKLRLARMGKARDGEVFLRIVRDADISGSCKLNVVLYEPEQVGDTLGMIPEFWKSGAVKEYDGISYDTKGKARAYRFSRLHPGAFGTSAMGETYMVPAEQVIHYAHICRAGQHRGMSELTPALIVFNDLRRFNRATIAAAETAAEISLIIKTDTPAPGGDEQVQFMDVVEFARNSGVALPDGWEAMQLKSEHPIDTYVEFTDAKLCEAARALGVPFAVAKGDSSKSNYASGRLDFQHYYRRIHTERTMAERVILNRLLAIFESFDRLIFPADYKRETAAKWTWDGFEHVDPVKEAKADSINLANGVTTVRELCEKQGKDFNAITAERKREQDEFKRLGLAAPAVNADTGDTE